MPRLDWIGKEKVITHHRDVPFRVLKHVYGYLDGKQYDSPTNSGNLVVHGDNLVALKSLLPQYEGKVDCIYIDPPYNTGNEKWIYNDNVNDPHIKKWLGEVVGAQGEDLSRDDKWLCMMYPRLVLLQRLLSENGAIFISIDDNEEANLKLICDEIFGAHKFVANISWQRTYSTRNDSTGIVREVEHILVYSNSIDWSPNKLERTADMNAIYKSPDNDPRLWTSSSVSAPGASTHQGMVYAIQHPFSGDMLYPTTGRCWTLGQLQMLENLQSWASYELKDIHDDEARAKICGLPVSDIRKEVKAIVLACPLEEAKKKATTVLKKGNWPYFYFTNNGKGGLRRKTYLDDMGGRLPTNLWPFDETGHTDEAKKELLAIFEGNASFDTPKPIRLIERVLQIATKKDSIVLDSFAGSGTTAHAVLSANKKDGGNRHFILVELGDYADTITCTRIKKAISGYGSGNKHVNPLGGGFDYYELGETLFDEEDNIRATIPEATIREYLYFSETKKPLTRERIDNSYLLDVYNDTGYYLYYKPQEITVLSYDTLNIITVRSENYVIYADICTLSEEFMLKNNIVFKKIPRDIKQF